MTTTGASFLTARTRSAPQGFGRPLPRKEDARLVTGRGRFSDDFSLPGQAHAHLVRSPHPHARILSIEATAALSVPGVLAVLTGKDAAADGLASIPHKPVPTNPNEFPLAGREGGRVLVTPHPPLPADAVRFVGEAVAMVIAETAGAAADGAERVRVSWEPLPAVTATPAAAAAAAPVLWNELGSNLCVDSVAGDARAADAAFAAAAHTVRLDTWVPRITGVPLEPRAALAVYDAASGRYTLYAGSGGVVRHKSDLAEVLGVPESAVRVVAEDVGGNFGTRNSFYPEFALVAWAAKRLGRPVKWTCERREAFLTDYQARDLLSRMELALDADGGFLALRGVNTSNVGAHTVTFVPLNKGRELATTVYRVPAAAVRGRAVLSNTAPLSAYRSAGRPQVMFVMERLIDLAARRHGFDRLELRRQNLVPAAAMPYTNPFGIVYDSGDYAATQDRAVALADWAGFEARRREARSRGRYRGIGLANYIEIATGAPRERAHITVRPEGQIDVVIGTLAAGQGHETSFAQLVVEWLGVELAQVRLISGDTDRVPVGGGSHSGRSMRLGGVVMAKAADRIVEKGARLAAWRLESAVADLEFSGGRFRVRGTDRSVHLFELAAAARRDDAPDELRGPLEGECDETVSTPSFPYGCAVCEVEVDPETGVVEVVRYTSVDDVGRAINPLIVDGQTHGGIVQGLGQALWEHCRYDAVTGQLQSGSFMDYAMPRADLLPSFTTEISEVPSTSNPLGLRGGGEGGTTPALGAAVNAIVDALAELGVEHLEMPVTAERVWRAIQAAGST
ncbi:MAG TPA: xanthine dehydrogenase family protein molybdopterin-binding subunit [Candidatus Deferrimicrobiaceae bacterium]|nr:xanthine dehydrogenase family protein molybdopterin-binding subunit [Candidatus Deferrimicrobiaceae bacterium]